jgi:hypothetical protein
VPRARQTNPQGTRWTSNEYAIRQHPQQFFENVEEAFGAQNILADASRFDVRANGPQPSFSEAEAHVECTPKQVEAMMHPNVSVVVEFFDVPHYFF